MASRSASADTIGHSPPLAQDHFAGLVFFFIDEAWARQETHKRFNWLSLLDEAGIAFFAGMALSYFQALKEGRTDLSLRWPLIFSLMAGAVLLAALLEILRPHRPHPVAQSPAEPLDPDLVQRIRTGSRWTYWESQNPLWLLALLLIGGTMDLLLAIVFLFIQPWIALILAPVALILFGLAGGLRVCVTRDRLTVRLGLIPVPILNLRLTDVQAAQTHEFSPLADFGGYGIRWNGKMWAYFLRGTRGIKLQTAKGKQYLIGSDHPDRLAMVLQTAVSSPTHN